MMHYLAPMVGIERLPASMIAQKCYKETDIFHKEMIHILCYTDVHSHYKPTMLSRYSLSFKQALRATSCLTCQWHNHHDP